MKKSTENYFQCIFYNPVNCFQHPDLRQIRFTVTELLNSNNEVSRKKKYIYQNVSKCKMEFFKYS